MLPIAFFVSHLVLHGPWEHAPLFYLAATVPCVLCLTCSSIYHTFMPLSSGEKTYSTLLFIDYLRCPSPQLALHMLTARVLVYST